MLQRQKQDFQLAYQQLNQQLQETQSLLSNYYDQAAQELDRGKYIVNNGIIKELRLYLSQITKTAQLAGSGTNLFLLTLNTHDQPEQEEQNIEVYVQNNRQNNHIALRKGQLQDRQINRIRSRYTNVNSIQLVSNTLKMEQIISDKDIPILKPFAKISTLSVKGSHISDEGIQNISQLFSNLKEIDISRCKFIGDNGVKMLSGYQFVGIKASQIEGVSQQSILTLITTSYNLNYLDISHIKGFDYQDLLLEIRQIYLANSLNFKWLQLICNPGTILFVNKLAYLTHLTTNDTITDREVQILLGQQPMLDGLYINCCEELHSETVNLLIKKCPKLMRLGLRRYVKLGDALLEDLASKMSYIQYLDLSECCSVTNRGVISLGNQMSKIKEISLSKCISVGDQGVIYLIQKMPSLRSIDLSHCKNITDYVIYKLCDCLPTIQGLYLTKCELITNQAIISLSQKLTSLTVLVLNGCQNLDDSSLTLVFMRLRKLRRLQIEWCAVSQKCVEFISQNLNQLQILNLNYCNPVTDDTVINLARYATKLHTLSLFSCQKITKKGFMRMFQSLKHLRSLGLRQCVGLSDMGVEHLCNNNRGQLTHLDISWCTQVGDSGLLHLSQFQQQLLYINLGGCSLITDNAVGWLCSSLNRLEYLNLTLCEQLTDRSVSQIGSNLPQLRILFLCQLKKITDSSVSTLTALQNLQELHLSGCTQITSSSLIALLHNLQKLQCLNISQCPNIFAQSLLLLVQRMRNLKRFYIASLEVNDSFLQMVGQYMHKVQMLGMQYCRKITDTGLTKMIYRTPSLLKVDLQNTNITQQTKKTIFQQLSSRSLYNIIT